MDEGLPRHRAGILQRHPPRDTGALPETPVETDGGLLARQAGTLAEIPMSCLLRLVDTHQEDEERWLEGAEANAELASVR